MTVIARLTMVIGVAGLLLLLTEAPASAHASGDVTPTNYVTRVDPTRVPRVTVRAVDVGTRIELRNEGPRPVIVAGYQGEPYLRVGGRGVFENRRSPATYLNRNLLPGERAVMPREVDAKAAPRWKRVSQGETARWHDHRAHWMLGSPPAAVRQAPDRTQVVIDDWRIPLRIGDRNASIRGDVLWRPGTSPWPWLLGAAVLAVGLVLAARTPWWRTAALAALTLMTLAEIVHLVGQWNATTAGLSAKAWSSFYPALALAAIVFTTVRVVRSRDVDVASPLILLSGMMVAIVSGLGDVAALSRSQLVFDGPAWLGRTTVAIALGAGTGCVLGAGYRLWSPRFRVRTFRQPSSATNLPDPSGVQ